MNNFQRNWKHYFNEENDQTVFVLDEKPWAHSIKNRSSFIKAKCLV